MVVCLVKQQWRRAAFLVMAFCVILTLQISVDWENSRNGKYYEEQTAYLAGFDLRDRQSFFTALLEDRNAAVERVAAIKEFAQYKGEIPEGVVNPADAMALGAVYADLDMLIWRQNMLSLPGNFTATIRDDEQMLVSLEKRLYYTRIFSTIIENHKELAARSIRRGGSLVNEHELALKNLEAISHDFPVMDTAYTQNLLDYMQGDWYFAAILALAFFGVFSGAVQQRVTWQVAVSRLGVTGYVLSQLAATIVLTVVMTVLYYIGVILACSLWQPGQIAWTLPIQCLFGETFDSVEIVLDLKVWEFVALLIGLKCLFGILVSSMILLCSLLSRNNVFAAITALALCGSLIILHDKGKLGGLLIGNGSCLLEGLCWFDIEGALISYSAVYAVGTVAAAVTILGITTVLAKPVLRKRVR